MPLVAFQNRDLGEQFLAHTLGSDELQLTGEDALDPETLEELIGEPLFLFQDQCMMDEIRRRGTGFPFCEFVSEYGRELWVTS